MNEENVKIAESAELLGLAERTAREAGGLLASFTGRVSVADTKSSPTDVVTEMDRKAEGLIRSRILAERPGDAILGEEEGQRGDSSESGVRWVVDPLDGTVNYLYGLRDWAVSIAAEVFGEIVAGAVFVPRAGELFTASLGAGAWLTLTDTTGSPAVAGSRAEGGSRAVAGSAAVGGSRAVAGSPAEGGSPADGSSPASDDSPAAGGGRRRLRIGPGVTLDRALVATGFGYRADRRTVQGEVVAALLPQVRDIRRAGSASVDLCSVAAGRVDAYYERGLNYWDYAAGALIAREAGAIVAGLRPGTPPGPSLTVAAAPSLFAPLSAALTALNPERDALSSFPRPVLSPVPRPIPRVSSSRAFGATGTAEHRGRGRYQDGSRGQDEQ